MAKVRRQVAAALRDHRKELSRLRRFDTENQRRFARGLGRGSSLTQRQLHLLTEAIFFAGFRAHETFMREVFLLYCLEKTPPSGTQVSSFVRPRDYLHAEQLVQAQMPFLDWASPDTVIERSELYLKDGGPIKAAYTTNLEALRDYKKIRNHIAHNSPQSLSDFAKVVRKYHGTIPLSMPTPGELLLLREQTPPNRYHLQKFLDVLDDLAGRLT